MAIITSLGTWIGDHSIGVDSSNGYCCQSPNVWPNIHMHMEMEESFRGNSHSVVLGR